MIKNAKIRSINSLIKILNLQQFILLNTSCTAVADFMYKIAEINLLSIEHLFKK